MSGLKEILKAEEKFFPSIGELKRDLLFPFRKKALISLLNLKEPLVRNAFPFDYSIADKERPPKVALSTIAPYLLSECRHSFLVFVNGSFDPSLSDVRDQPELKIYSSKEAGKAPVTFPFSLLDKFLNREQNILALLNSALHPEGAFLYLPPGKKMTRPLQILNWIEEENFAAFIFPRLHLLLGEDSQMELLVVEKKGISEKVFSCFVQEFFLERKAKLFFSLFTQNQSHSFHAVRANLKRESMFQAVSLIKGNQSQQDFQVILEESLAKVDLSGLWVIREKGKLDLKTFISHEAPRCVSRQLFKGFLEGESVSHFQGRVSVGRLAHETNASQHAHALLLSDRARATVEPFLEIHADDVSVSHGATIGKLDEKAIFYLKSRGFLEEEAKKILMESFSREVLEKLPRHFCEVCEECFLRRKRKDDKKF